MESKKEKDSQKNYLYNPKLSLGSWQIINTLNTNWNFNMVQGSKKTPSGRPGQVDFPFGQATFSPYLPHGQGVHRLNFWWRFWEDKVNFRFKGNQVFRWSLTKITIYNVILLIAWRGLTAQKWLPSTWSKSAPIRFLSRIINSRVGHGNAVVIS